MKIICTYRFQPALITKQNIGSNSPYFKIVHKNVMFYRCLVFNRIGALLNVQLLNASMCNFCCYNLRNIFPCKSLCAFLVFFS